MAEKGALPLSATSLPRVNHVPCAPGGFGDQGSVEIPSTALPAAPIAVHSLCFRSREKRLPRSGRVTAHGCYKSFNCNTCGSPRKCCKQKTYGTAKPFRCNTYKKRKGPFSKCRPSIQLSPPSAILPTAGGTRPLPRSCLQPQGDPCSRFA